MNKKKQALERLENQRRQVEERLALVRQSIEREVGWAPKAKAFAVPLIGFACGIALAAMIVKKRR